MFQGSFLTSEIQKFPSICRDFDEIFRPLSRASLVTDAEIDANQAMSRELSNIESQFYPDDDQY